MRELNKIDVREQIAKIIESEQMTAKQFANEIGVAASTISNILSDRNKPSTEVCVRILNRFRTINSDWLMLGTGSMYRPNGAVTQTSLFGDMRPIDLPEQNDNSSAIDYNRAQGGLNTPMHQSSAKEYKAEPRQTVQRQIARIIIYYTDGTYEER